MAFRATVKPPGGLPCSLFDPRPDSATFLQRSGVTEVVVDGSFAFSLFPRFF